jgi:predicted XRE-type DNA-binding protein
MTNIFEEVGMDKADGLYKEVLMKAKSLDNAVGRIGSAIQAELNRLGNTEKEIVEATGIKRSHVRRLLTGEFKKFSLAQLVDIALEIGLMVEVKVIKPKVSK